MQLYVVIMCLSAFAFVLGLFMLIPENTRKAGLKMMLYSGIVFLIGFGACVAVISFN